MPRTRFLSRMLCATAVALPLSAVFACSSAFTPSATGDDASVSDEAGEDGAADAAEEDVVIIIHHDAAQDAGQGGGEDATVDAHEDAQNDGPSDGPVSMDGGDGAVGCPTGYLTCSGKCVPDNVTNCGTCGHDCANLPHVSGTVSCTAGGMCSFQGSACAPGWSDCNGNPDDGCETDITKTNHCGSCTTMCTASDPVCQGSGSTYTCVTGCSAGTPTLCSGSCVNTGTDPTNCGSCGHDCTSAPKNAQNTCVNSMCSFSCNTGYSDCSGACVNETNDTSNCGACGKTCPGPTNGNGQATCSSSTCGIVCNSGYSDCSGACFNESNDPKNCGSCGHVCPAGPANSTVDCSAGTCGWTCNGGYEVCGSSCIVSAPDTVHGVFVAQGGGTSPSCGTELAPCGTVTAALTVVSQSVGAKTILYLDDKSTFTESVQLLAGVTLQGGWLDNAGTWVHECNPSTLPTIQSPSNGAPAIAGNYNGASTLDSLVVKNETTAGAGQSLFAVSVNLYGTANKAQLTLSNVSIVVAAGGPGADGAAGGNGTDGSTAGCASSGTGANGSAGPAGNPGVASYSPAGTFFSQTGATQGQTGGTGQPGTAPASGPQCDSAGCPADSCLWESAAHVCGPCGGTVGQVCGGAGVSGCPGTGSVGGQPGGAGGASVGIFLYGAVTLTFENTTIQTGNGAKGGNGGPAGTIVGAGQPGVAGATVCDYPNCGGTQTSCHSTGCGAFLAGGSAGGQGGSGGLGGQGGGGVGGDSFCIVAGGSAPTVSTSGLTCSNGKGGAAGLPNGNAGQSGVTKTF